MRICLKCGKPSEIHICLSCKKSQRKKERKIYVQKSRTALENLEEREERLRLLVASLGTDKTEEELWLELIAAWELRFGEL